MILFSLGYTGFSAKDMPKQVVGALVDAFASLDQKVIMRFDQSVMPYVPNNVLVSNWIPQQDLLGMYLQIYEGTIMIFNITVDFYPSPLIYKLLSVVINTIGH